MHRTRLIPLAAAAAAIVVVPATAEASSAAKPPTNLQIAKGASFTTFTALVKRAGLVRTLSPRKAKQTLLLPTNAAFRKMPRSTYRALLSNRKRLRAVLTYHVLRGNVSNARLRRVSRVTALSRAGIAVRRSGRTVQFNRLARIVEADLVTRDGRVHVMNRVLLPPS